VAAIAAAPAIPARPRPARTALSSIARRVTRAACEIARARARTAGRPDEDIGVRHEPVRAVAVATGVDRRAAAPANTRTVIATTVVGVDQPIDRTSTPPVGLPSGCSHRGARQRHRMTAERRRHSTASRSPSEAAAAIVESPLGTITRSERPTPLDAHDRELPLRRMVERQRRASGR
jgi:hypothetical protein